MTKRKHSDESKRKERIRSHSTVSRCSVCWGPNEVDSGYVSKEHPMSAMLKRTERWVQTAAGERHECDVEVTQGWITEEGVVESWEEVDCPENEDA